MASGEGERAARDATMERRHSLAAQVRCWLCEPAPDSVGAATPELEALAAELDDDGLTFDPVCAVTCVRLLSDPEQSPLLNAALPPEDLRSRIEQIRCGFARADL